MGIAALNLAEPGAEPIVKLLREIPSALRFVLDHPLEHLKAVGSTTASTCTVSPVGDLFTTLHEATGNTDIVSSATDVDSVGVRYVNAHESSSSVCERP